MNKRIISLYFRLIAILIFETIIMYFAIPLLLGYPPHSENFVFQKETLGFFNHINQYITFVTVAIIGYIPALNLMFKNTNIFLKAKNKKAVSEKTINNVRKEFDKIQKRLMIFYIITLISIIFSAYSLIEVSLGVKIKFAIVYFLLSSLAWVVSITVIKGYMIRVLEETYEVLPQYISFEKNKKFQTNIFMHMIPIFMTIIGVLIMYMYSNTTKLGGDKIFEYYKTEIQQENYDGLTVSEIEEKLKKVNKKEDKDFYFIVDENNENKWVEEGHNPKEITDFLVIYADMFVEEGVGKTYEYFGEESEAFVSKVILEDGTPVWIGVKYITLDHATVVTFIILTVGVLSVYTIIVTVWANNMSYTLRAISTNLSNIALGKDIEQYVTLPIYSYDEIGELAHSYNEIQKINNEHIEEIRNNQKTILEHERLVSLGQMIGGIAHNLKTPILSIAGAAEGIKYLAEEMEESLTTPTVTIEDKKEILEEQEEWVEKIKVHLEYMNDIITAVKGQATTFTTEREERFTVKDLFKNVDMLTAHEFKNALIELEIINNVPNNKYIKGDFNSLLQIINNIVVNAIQAYDKKTKGKVQLIANIGDLSENLVISVRDKGKGMSQEVQEKLFKQMVTTKGKYGTGLGLYMSYSTIKGKFQGEIKFESKEGKGTTFHVILPSIEKREEILNGNIYRSEQSSIGGKSEIEQTESSRVDVYHKEAQEAVEKFNQEYEKESSKKTTLANYNVKNPKTINQNKTNSKEKNKTKSKDQSKTKK